MPSSLEKLQKFLRLEAERGYDNRAVVGGLNKILPAWENDARKENVNETLLQTISARLNQYPELNLRQRATTIREVLEITHENQPGKQFRKGESLPRIEEKPETLLDVSHQERFSPQRPSRKPHDSTTWVENIPSTQGLNAPLTVIHGIGPRSAESLSILGLNTLGDLLYYFPRRYDDYSALKPINRLQYGEELTVIGTVQAISNRSAKGGQMQITEAVLGDGTGYLRLTWFNQPWLTSQILSGKSIVVSGKIDMYLGRLGMNSPDWEPLEQDHLHTNRIVPVYPLSGHITQRWLRKIMYQTVNFWAPRVPDYLPSSIRESAGLVDLPTAIVHTHFPDSISKLESARARLAFDEIFFLQLGVLQQKRNWESYSGRIFPSTEDWLAGQVDRLPFELTNAQKRTLQDLRTDLESGRPMNRLLQGDVGSGKTILAFLAASMVINHSAQAAIMAPTGILAEQHYRNMLTTFFPPDEASETPLTVDQIRLLVGDTPEAEKEEIRNGLADGTIRLIIGTHALIEDPVIFHDLQLIIVDEQHRFGVAQRSLLRAKGNNPHLLVMTATPIPRSLALTIYGDLDLSVLDELPAGRQPIETHVLAPLERERAYTLIRSQVAEGRQAFIIYPLVEKGERDEVKAAVEEHARLQSEVFPHFKIGLLHGRMKPAEKDQVMSQFRAGEYQILVSTSVVEVGVDVPNATVMLVEGANRFGLSQLHQFRGRVGRGQAKSFCLLVPETEDAVENKRLAVMAETNDGFVLAEHDLDQRGPGDFLGTRQSGFAEFKMANLTDIRLIEKARKQAIALFDQDPDLSNPDHAALLKTFHRFWGDGRGDVS
ncbi:MAG: ATP-dependent DNA helicase RecG [Anaerolineaceae bacterium]|jgi:ATP-dependent DNA helicase RecG